MSTPTPRTDSEEYPEGEGQSFHVVSADFARTLERELGAPLIARAGRTVSLTEEGARILQRILDDEIRHVAAGTKHFLRCAERMRSEPESLWQSLVTLAGMLVFRGLTLFVLGGKNIMDLIEFLANDLMLPLGGMLIALFAGWVLSRDAVREELAISSPLLFNLALWLIRVVAPIGVLIVFIAELSK